MREEKICLLNFHNKEIIKDDFYSILNEQYELYVKSAENISHQRNLMNTFFIGLQAIFIGILTAILDKDQVIFGYYQIVLFLVGYLLICLIWWVSLLSYRRLNSCKFKVIKEFEKYLPASPFSKAEWDLAEKGRNPKKYIPFTQIEMLIPILFAVLYITIGLTFFI